MHKTFQELANAIAPVDASESARRMTHAVLAFPRTQRSQYCRSVFYFQKGCGQVASRTFPGLDTMSPSITRFVRRKVEHDHVRVPSRCTQSQQVSSSSRRQRFRRAAAPQYARRHDSTRTYQQRRAVAATTSCHMRAQAKRYATVAYADMPWAWATSRLPLQQSRLRAKQRTDPTNNRSSSR